MRSTTIGCVIALLTGAAVGAGAAEWVTSPHPQSTAGSRCAAGETCSGYVDVDGDRLLFFDTWTGTWLAHDLPATHAVADLEAAGDLVLYVAEDLAVAFDGPDRVVHEQALQGSLLDQSFSHPSWACGPELAVVITDQAMHVYDARRDAWSVWPYSVANYAGHRSTGAAADFVWSDLYRDAPHPPVSLAYSLVTGTFAVGDPGVAAVNSGQLLDHGFTGFSGGDDPVAQAYSAITGSFAPMDPGECLGGPMPVSRQRRELCHLWGFGWTEWHPPPELSYYRMRIFDTLSGSWIADAHAYDYLEETHQTDVDMGGCFTSNECRRDADYRHFIGIFYGASHNTIWHDSGLSGLPFARDLGGSVAGYHTPFDGEDRWWCTSVAHPPGLFIWPIRPTACCRIAGEDYVSFGALDPADPTMGLYFYNGDRNETLSLQTWRRTDIWAPDHDGTHLHCLLTYGDDVDVIFYSAPRHEVARRDLPAGSYPATYVNARLALVYQNGVGDFLFDAATGTVHERGCDYDSNSLGDWCCLGVRPSDGTLQAYSAVTGNWTTGITGTEVLMNTGGRVALVRRHDRTRFWGYGAVGDVLLELTPDGGVANPGLMFAGNGTALVSDSDRLYAFWPQSPSPVEDGAPPVSLGSALAELRCRPNPFNGRLVVSFRLPRPADVSVDVFDLRGRRVARLLREARPAGPVELSWTTGRAASGSYLVRVAADDRAAVRKVMLVE